MTRWSSLSIAALVITAPLLFADIIHLKNGEQLEGTIKRDKGGWEITDSSGRTLLVLDREVSRIEKTGNLSAAELAVSKLAALRRSVEPLSDINQVIDRYQRFIEQNKETPIAAEADRELATWRERKARGFVKVGSEWVSPDAHAEMLERAAETLTRIREMIREGRYKEAGAAVEKLLAASPDNASALYLRALLAHKQGEVGVAKRHFERVRELLRDHGPTLNNLAAIAFKQKQTAQAIALYVQAMQASPRNRQVLDNVAEALHALPQDQRNSTNAKKAETIFKEQDAELQKELEQQGLFRWGATYVTKDRYDEAMKEQEKVQAKLQQLDQEYRRVESRLREIERTIELNEDSLVQIDSDRAYVDSSGRIFRTNRPSIYYDLRREIDKLKLEQKDLLGKLDGFHDRARAIEQESPHPQFTGTQRLIEVEGTPLVASTPPATKPGTPAARPPQDPM
jgi:tetratricopeptide (TPR) repeat protein